MSGHINQKTKEWFAKGDSDLRNAEIVIMAEDPSVDTICFHCQQAAEKYLKGFLVQHSISFPKTHDLDYLLALCLEMDEGFKEIKGAVRALTEYAVESRYPADILITYSILEAREALGKTNKIVSFIKARLNCGR